MTYGEKKRDFLLNHLKLIRIPLCPDKTPLTLNPTGCLDFNFKATNEEVHLWMWGFSDNSYCMNLLENFLNSEEKDRREKFRHKAQKDCFTYARGFLRVILGSYLGKNPDLILFEYTESGKPYLQGKQNKYLLKFSLSHTGSLIVCAITKNKTIGVDIEDGCNYSEIDMLDISSRFFKKHEKSFLESLDYVSRVNCFTRLWTIKEAYCKAIGSGIISLEKTPDFSLCGYEKMLCWNTLNVGQKSWKYLSYKIKNDTWLSIVVYKRS